VVLLGEGRRWSVPQVRPVPRQPQFLLLVINGGDVNGLTLRIRAHLGNGSRVADSRMQKVGPAVSEDVFFSTFQPLQWEDSGWTFRGEVQEGSGRAKAEWLIDSTNFE
jgi:hypothetical protein